MAVEVTVLFQSTFPNAEYEPKWTVNEKVVN